MTVCAADTKVVSSLSARLSSTQTWGCIQHHKNVKWYKHPKYNAQEPSVGDDVSFPVAHVALYALLKHTLGQYLLVLYFGSFVLENLIN